MTPKHTNADCPTLPISAVGRAFSFSFRRPHTRLEICAVFPAQAASSKIHNMNAFEALAQERIHIMNFLVADQDKSDEIHIMNFLNSQQIGSPVVWWKLASAHTAAAPSTSKGAQNVMS